MNAAYHPCKNAMGELRKIHQDGILRLLNADDRDERTERYKAVVCAVVLETYNDMLYHLISAKRNRKRAEMLEHFYLHASDHDRRIQMYFRQEVNETRLALACADAIADICRGWLDVDPQLITQRAYALAEKIEHIDFRHINEHQSSLRMAE